mgnify:CR=1 FL=1|tara:strand:- start:1721 stop:2314 length:594 start_codon:yes stop_codon:yes gene_type:complete
MKIIKGVFFALVFLSSSHLIAQKFIEVYLQNATELSILTPDGVTVQPGRLDLLKQIPIPENWNDVFVTSFIQVSDESGISPCQLGFRTYKDLNFHNHIMKTVIFVRQKGNKLVCTPRAVEFDQGGFIRNGGLRLGLKETYHKIRRHGDVRTGKPYLVYEYTKPLIPYLYVKPGFTKKSDKRSLRSKNRVKQNVVIAP